ncbi:type III PLP-dependent enzyme [Kutzneria kofuensis]|uniref:Diaminopimelate decarboxylase n=1 Tax=Kutzneria kofuensis TaxID=103725 RepID=A0A7W9KPU5_9PSEU|nr:type III PLP-dependent enzyme [Kutzneria kofuensis]MBB5896506.1 diaminopimelate decarboxylase [Kutzneria kofuensis]
MTPADSPRDADLGLDPALLEDIARDYGTPAYVYDLDAVRAAYIALTADLPQPSDLLYSLKANPHPAVVEALVAVGAGAEVSSSGELAVALAAGCPPRHVLYTGPGKTADEVRTALAAGVRLFSVESPGDRARVEQACELLDVTVDVLVRLNYPRASAGGSLRMTGRPTAFGVDVGDAGAVTALLRPGRRVRPVGTHTFFATNVADEQDLRAEFHNALAVVRAVGGDGFAPTVLALGGGFSAPNARPGTLPRYHSLRADLAEQLDVAFPAWRSGVPRVLFESGRHLTATSGTLLTTVLDTKRSGDRTFVVLDAGVNVLGGMTGLGRLRAPDAQARVVGRTDRPDEPEQRVTLVGPLCTPLDVLSTTATIAAPRRGQLLAIPNVGAYGTTASLLAFLSRPAPVEVIVDHGVVRRAERLVLHSEEVHPDSQ